MNNKNPRFPNKLLVFGIGLFMLGGLLLLWTLGFISMDIYIWKVLWPLPFLCVGLWMLYLVYLKGKSERFILPGMILMLGGLFFLLFNTIIPEKSLTRIWPAFMDIAGLSLLPYAFKKSRNTRIGLLISSITLICLSLLFFLFSLNPAHSDFSEFVVMWWPVIFIILGVILTIAYLLYKPPKE